MKRRTLDLLFSAGGVVFSVLLLVVGLILTNQANFADDYVTDQLSAQKINFTPAKFLSEEEAKADCLVKYGTTDGDDTTGQLMSSGKMAECYANEYIKRSTWQSRPPRPGTRPSTSSSSSPTMGGYVRPRARCRWSMLWRQAAEGGDQGGHRRGETALHSTPPRGCAGHAADRPRPCAVCCSPPTASASSVSEQDRRPRCSSSAPLVIFLLSIVGFIHAFTSKKADDVILVAEHHSPDAAKA